MAVAQARDRGAAAGVDVAAAVPTDDLDPLAPNRDRIIVPKLTMEDVAHGDPRPSVRDVD
jgi:hypothetical protein